MKEELSMAKENAVSFPGSVPPEETEEIGREEHFGVMFIYFKAKNGEYYYGTDRGMKFAREMEEKIKKEKHRIH